MAVPAAQAESTIATTNDALKCRANMPMPVTLLPTANRKNGPAPGRGQRLMRNEGADIIHSKCEGWATLVRQGGSVLATVATAALDACCVGNVSRRREDGCASPGLLQF